MQELEQFIPQILSGASGAGAYGLVLLVLLLCGLGIPLPEDVALITGGYLVFSQDAQLGFMIATAFLGILGGDSAAFYFGRCLGEKLTSRWPFRYVFSQSKRKKVEHLFARYGERIVVVARFMPGVRAVTYFFAGTAGMKYSRFILFDGLAATISAPVFVYLGYRFGGEIEWLVGAVRRGQGVALASVGTIAAIYLLVRYLRTRYARNNSLSDTTAALDESKTSEEKLGDANARSVEKKRLSARPPAI